MKRLLLAPFTMHRRVLEMIRRETRNAREGKPARIIAKMNALVEEGVIRALYAASAGGRADRPHRARRLLAAARRARRVGQHPRALDPRPLPRASPRVVLRERRRRRTCGCRPPTGWDATCSGASKSRFRCATRRCASAVIDEGLKAYLADNREAWALDADGRWSKVRPRRGAQAPLRAERAARHVCSATD